MTRPRSHYVDSTRAGFYHVTSRCVRRAWLMGDDPLTGNNYDHRKALLLNRLKHLSRYFAIEVMGYAIMSNHFHLVVKYDPVLADSWSDEEVAERWCAAFSRRALNRDDPGRITTADFSQADATRYQNLLLDADRLQRCRSALGSLSRFMQHLKQPFAVWVNREDGCRGHVFESRFYSGELATEEDLLACMAYVDLNPVEAGIAKSIRAAEHTALHERLFSSRFCKEQLEEYLAPLWEEPGESEQPATTENMPTKVRSCTLIEYARQLALAAVYFTNPDAQYPSGVSIWMARLLKRKRQREGPPAPAFYDYTC